MNTHCRSRSVYVGSTWLQKGDEETQGPKALGAQGLGERAGGGDCVQRMVNTKQCSV